MSQTISRLEKVKSAQIDTTYWSGNRMFDDSTIEFDLLRWNYYLLAV